MILTFLSFGCDGGTGGVKAASGANWLPLKTYLAVFTVNTADDQDIISKGVYIDATYQMADADANNFRRWPILALWVWPNRVVTGSYPGEINAMKSWLNRRIAWMDAQLSD